jgi:hypothetical protein
MSKTPWTPGPWITGWDAHDCNPRSTITIGYPGIKKGERSLSERELQGNANAAIIAIAPEMAEAIMEWDTMPRDAEDVEALEIKLRNLARRLRAIGEKHDD